MADLPTNYLDDILAQSMNGKRKYRITRADGTFEEVTLEDVSEYEQVGSNFGAGDINKTNQAVNEKFDSGDVVDPMLTTEPGFAADAYQTKLQFDEQNKNLGGLRFGVDGDGNGGYYKADDSFVPFRRTLAYNLKNITSSDRSVTFVAKSNCRYDFYLNFYSVFGYYVHLIKNGSYLINENGERTTGIHSLQGELSKGDTLTLDYRAGDANSAKCSGHLLLGEYETI